MTPEKLLGSNETALAVYEWVRERLDSAGIEYEVRTSKSQVAFRGRRGFAYVWMPGQYLSDPDAEAVLSLALRHEIKSDRFKEVAHPAPTSWMHHLEVTSMPGDLDDEIAGWLQDAANDG